MEISSSASRHPYLTLQSTSCQGPAICATVRVLPSTECCETLHLLWFLCSVVFSQGCTLDRWANTLCSHFFSCKVNRLQSSFSNGSLFFCLKESILKKDSSCVPFYSLYNFNKWSLQVVCHTDHFNIWFNLSNLNNLTISRNVSSDTTQWKMFFSQW